MKKAKLMLLAIAVTGILSGVGAVKKRTLQIFYSTDEIGWCTVPFETFLTTTVPGVGIEVPYSTASTTEDGCSTFVTDSD